MQHHLEPFSLKLLRDQNLPCLWRLSYIGWLSPSHRATTVSEALSVHMVHFNFSGSFRCSHLTVTFISWICRVPCHPSLAQRPGCCWVAKAPWSLPLGVPGQKNSTLQGSWDAVPSGVHLTKQQVINTHLPFLPHPIWMGWWTQAHPVTTPMSPVPAEGCPCPPSAATRESRGAAVTASEINTVPQPWPASQPSCTPTPRNF